MVFQLTKNRTSSSSPTGPCASCFNFCVESIKDFRQSSRSSGRLLNVSFSNVECSSPLEFVYSSSRLASSKMLSAIIVSDAILGFKKGLIWLEMRCLMSLSLSLSLSYLLELRNTVTSDLYIVDKWGRFFFLLVRLGPFSGPNSHVDPSKVRHVKRAQHPAPPLPHISFSPQGAGMGVARSMS